MTQSDLNRRCHSSRVCAGVCERESASEWVIVCVYYLGNARFAPFLQFFCVEDKTRSEKVRKRVDTHTRWQHSSRVSVGVFMCERSFVCACGSCMRHNRVNVR